MSGYDAILKEIARMYFIAICVAAVLFPIIGGALALLLMYLFAG